MGTILFVYMSCLIWGLLEMQSGAKTKIYYSNGISSTRRKGLNFAYWSIFLVVTVVSGFREGFVDTNSYRNIFETVGTNFNMVTNDSLRIEEGFRFICYLLNYVSNNSQILLIVVAVLVNFSIFKIIDKYSENRWLSVLLYICSIYLTTMNTMRQYIVVAVLLMCIPLLMKKKWLLFLVISLLLSAIHSTAILAGVFLILCCGEFTNKRVLILGGGMLLLAFSPAESFLAVLQSTDMQDYADMYVSLEKGGVNVLRLAVQAVPALMAFFYYYKIVKKNDAVIPQEYSFFMNLNILNMVVFVLATKSNYLARLAVYTEVFSILTIPFLLRRIIKRDQVYIGSIITAILYSVYFYYIIQGFGIQSVNALTPIFFGGN